MSISRPPFLHPRSRGRPHGKCHGLRGNQQVEEEMKYIQRTEHYSTFSLFIAGPGYIGVSGVLGSPTLHCAPPEERVRRRQPARDARRTRKNTAHLTSVESSQ